jgi:hypothetical protein
MWSSFIRHGRRVPLGEDGMSQLIEQLLARGGIQGFTGHDLRRTFTTLMTTASGDEFLAMRLIRDRVPGQGDRYIRYPMTELVEAIQRCSPLRQLGMQNGDNPGEYIPKIPTSITPESVAAETIKESGGDWGRVELYLKRGIIFLSQPSLFFDSTYSNVLSSLHRLPFLHP